MEKTIKKDFDVVHRHIQKISPLVINEPFGWLPHRWISPSWGPPYNVCQFVWDAFHQCLRYLHDGNADLFRDMIANHLHHQRSDGWMPLAIHHESGFDTAPESTGQPFIVQGALLYAKASGDLVWPAEVYQKLQRHLCYWEVERTVGNNLYCWWFDSGFDNDVSTTFFRPRSTACVSATTLMWMEYRAMSRLAGLLGKKSDASRYREKADSIGKAINERFWNEEYGCYADVQLRTGRHIIGLGMDGLPGESGKYSFLSWHPMIVLYPGLAPKARAQRQIEHYLLNPDHFWSRYGVRSLSASSEYYNNSIWGNPPRFSHDENKTASNWQGPVWFPVNYFMMHSLLHYGYRSKAEELADKTIRLLANSIRKYGYMTENYDAETGRPLYAPKFASWNMLADVMHKELDARSSPLLDAIC